MVKKKRKILKVTIGMAKKVVVNLSKSKQSKTYWKKKSKLR